MLFNAGACTPALNAHYTDLLPFLIRVIGVQCQSYLELLLTGQLHSKDDVQVLVAGSIVSD